MKTVLVSIVASLFLSSNAMAASKVCFGSTKSDLTKGIVLKAEIVADSVTLKTEKSVDGWLYDGVFPATNTKTDGRDGVTYLEYLGQNSDDQEYILINEDLLRAGTSGLLQIRSRGEVFTNYVFVCRDDQEAGKVSVTYEDFKNQILGYFGAETQGDGCKIVTKEVRNTITITIRKNGRLTSLEFNDRDRITSLVQGDDDYVRTYNKGDRNNLVIAHADDAYDHVTIDLGGRKTTCEVNY